MNQIVVVEGFRSGAILGACSVVLALLGLAPVFAWLPEISLVGAAILVPVAILGWTGFRAALRSGRIVAGPLAGALTGAFYSRGMSSRAHSHVHGTPFPVDINTGLPILA